MPPQQCCQEHTGFHRQGLVFRGQVQILPPGLYLLEHGPPPPAISERDFPRCWVQGGTQKGYASVGQEAEKSNAQGKPHFFSEFAWRAGVREPPDREKLVPALSPGA